MITKLEFVYKNDILLTRENPEKIPTKDDYITIDDICYWVFDMLDSFYYYNNAEDVHKISYILVIK